MKSDPETKKYAEQRVQEIVDRTVTNEREKFVSKLSEENASLKTTLGQMKRDLEQSKENLSNKEKESA